MLFIVSGCATVNEYVEKQITKPKYEELFFPFDGKLNLEHRKKHLYKCSLEAEAYADEKAEKAANAGMPHQDERLKCVSDVSTSGRIINTNCKRPSYENRDSALARQKRLGQMSREGLFKFGGKELPEVKKYRQRCMADNGYALEKVCYENCPVENERAP